MVFAYGEIKRDHVGKEIRTSLTITLFSMGYLILGDVHGRSIQDILHILNAYSLLCLSDFDQPTSIQEIMVLQERFEKEGKIFHIVPGNHDLAVLRNIDLYSPELCKQRTTIPWLHAELEKKPQVRQWLERIMEIRGGKNIDLFGDSRYPAILVHGSLDTQHATKNAYPEELDLWGRLLTEEDYRINFEAMMQRDLRIMIRGHDHFPAYATQDRDGKITLLRNTQKDVQIISGDAYELGHDKLHVINPGAFCDGWIARITEQENGCPVLRYTQLSRGY